MTRSLPSMGPSMGDHDGALRAEGAGVARVSRPARWAVSPLDFCVHMVSMENDHPPDGLKARCAAVLPTVVNQHDQPPPGPPCERCRLMFLADFGRDSSAC